MSALLPPAAGALLVLLAAPSAFAQDAAYERAASERAADEPTSDERASSEQTSDEQTAPGQTDRAASERAADEHAAPERTSDELAASEPASEERAASEPATYERTPYEQGEGRGFLYGAHFVSPIFLTSVERLGGAEQLSVGGGFGVRARLGWEFGLGLSAEVYGGLAVNGIDTGMRPVRDMMISAELGLAARYSIFFGSPFVPFVQVGVGLRYLDIEWPSGDEEDDTFALPVHAAVGAHFQLAPWVGLEVGALVDYTLGLAILEEGVVVLTPFVGVTLFAYDQDDRIAL